MKQEMDENTMYAKVWRTVLVVVGATIAVCWMASSAASWREAGIKVELMHIETSPDGMALAKLGAERALSEAQRAGYELQAKTCKP